MLRLRMGAALLAIGVLLGGCGAIRDTFSTIQQGFQAAQQIEVSPKAAVVAVSLFHAAERTATVYIKQKHCPVGIQRPTCMSPPIREQLAVAMEEGQKARDSLLDFVEGHPGPLGAQGAYEAVQRATATLKSIFAAYKIGRAA